MPCWKPNDNGKCPVILIRTAYLQIVYYLVQEIRYRFFSVPPNSSIRWKELIPNAKFSKSMICSQHFEECDVKKGNIFSVTFTLIPDGD